MPWKQAEYGKANECKKCECNGHAIKCHFSYDVFINSMGVSGGVCDDCMHNTEGINCEKCKPNFYYDKSLPFSHPNACKSRFTFW